MVIHCTCGSCKVIVYLWVVLVPLQVLSVDEALYPFLYVSRFNWELELPHHIMSRKIT